MGLKNMFYKSGNDAPSSDPAEEIAALARSTGARNPGASVPAVRGTPDNPPELSVPDPTLNPTRVQDSTIYAHAGIPDEALQRTGRVITLMTQLAALDPVSKRAAVVASISTFGIQPSEVVQTSLKQVQALDGWTRLAANDTATKLSQQQTKLENLRRALEQEQATLEQVKAAQKSFEDRIKQSKESINRVIEFFNTDPTGK